MGGNSLPDYSSDDDDEYLVMAASKGRSRSLLDKCRFLWF